MSAAAPGCVLCRQDGGELVWRGEKLRVILVDDENYPGYCRVIWNSHVKEMSDLAPDERIHLWRVVNVVEEALRGLLTPTKINLASLGNHVPHLHWHVIPRWENDPRYPEPIWAAPPDPRGADPVSGAAPLRLAPLATLATRLRHSLEELFPW